MVTEGVRPIFKDVSQGLNLSAIPEHLRRSKRFENIELQYVPKDTLNSVESALQVFPRAGLLTVFPKDSLGRPRINLDPRVPHYNVVAISDEVPRIQPDKPEVAFIHISGGGGSARVCTSIALSYEQQIKEQTDWNVPYSMAMSSSQSSDTVGQKFHRPVVVNAAYQAATIAEFVETHPAANLVLVGHSLSVPEVQALAPVLKKVFEEKGIDTRIAGLILEQGGGLHDIPGNPLTSRLKFLNRVNKTNTLKAEVHDRYPAPDDLKELEARLREAVRWGDISTVQRLRGHLNNMRNKYAFHPGLTDSQAIKLDAYNDALERSVDKSKGKQRDNFLKREEIDVTMNDTETKKLGFKDFWKMNIRMGKVTLLNKPPFMRRNPGWVRMMNEFPTGVIFGRKDPNFPAEEAILGMFRGLPSGELYSPFPFAPKLHIAQVESGHHLGTNPYEYAVTFADVCKKLVGDTLEKRGYSPRQLQKNQEVTLTHY